MLTRIVLDTNGLVARLIHPGGLCARLLDLAVDGVVVVCVEDRILAEYADVRSRRKFGRPVELVQRIRDVFRQSGMSVVAPPLAVRLPDPDAVPCLEVAASGDAVLVTGNLRHFAKAATGRVRVLRPAAYLENIREHP